MNAFARLARQLGRFGLVGVFNTGIDFAVTNVLFLLLRPSGDLGLLAISAFACSVAIANSYWMNSRWTFRAEARQPGAVRGFVVVAIVGLLVNTTVFLFVAKYLHLLVDLGPLATINLAKLAGVGAAMVVTFLGYRLGVFRTEATVAFRQTLRLDPASGPPRWTWLGGILLLALLARLAFLAMAPVAYGDAVSYSWVAWYTALGEPSKADSFWHTLFDFWEAIPLMLGFGQYPAMVLASLIPGLLLPIPVYLIGRRLYGESAGLIAALLVALHPRLIEYSVNGYAESFYVFAAAWAIWGSTALFQGERGIGPILALGLGLGGYFLARNEGLLLVLALLGATWHFVGRKDQTSRGPLLLATAIVAILTAGYVALSLSALGTSGLFAKASDLAKQHIETLDLGQAARETYGKAGGPEPMAALSWSEQISVLLERWPRNLRYAAERLPGVILSPIALFALALPLLSAKRGGETRAEIPLLIFGLWPLVFYPLIQLEPRLLFPTLIAVVVFGAGGLVASGRFFAHQLGDRSQLSRAATPLLVAVTVLLLLPVTPLLAWNSEVERGYHREVGRWIAEHVPTGARISGDGYGYVAATTFWAGRKGEPRRWTETPEELGSWALDHGFSVIVLYEEYLRDANPELLSALDEAPPPFRKLGQLEFPRVGRVTVWGKSD